MNNELEIGRAIAQEWIELYRNNKEFREAFLKTVTDAFTCYDKEVDNEDVQ